METRFLVIKDTNCRIAIKEWSFELSMMEVVTEKAQTIFEDFCEINNLNKNNFFWEITK